MEFLEGAAGAARQHGLLHLLLSGGRREHPFCAGERRPAPLPVASLAAGAGGQPGAGGVGVPGAVRRRGLPGRLPSWGCRVAPARRAVGDPMAAGRGGPAARDRSCGPGQRRELVFCPSARASRRRSKEGPRIWGFCFETFVSKKRAAPGSGRPHLFVLPVFGLLCSWLAPPTPCQAEPFLRTRPK